MEIIMKNIKTVVIVGSLAVIAVIAGIFIIVTSNSKFGLYITAFNGNVNISNPEKGTSEDASENRKLLKGDVLTVGSGGVCTLVYRTRKNTDINYMTVTENSQVFVTDDFDGKKDTELYLNRGTLISSNAENLGPCAVIRTANCSVVTGCAVSTVRYSLSEEGNYTDFASMGGNLYIQLYDEQGSKVNTEEPLGPGKNGRVVSGSSGPYFAFLNTDADLSDYSPAELKSLFAVASGVRLEFSPAQIKDAYNMLHISGGDDTPLEEIVTSADNGGLPIQTAETIATTLPDKNLTGTIITTIITSETSESDTSLSETVSETSETTTSVTTESKASDSQTDISDEFTDPELTFTDISLSEDEDPDIDEISETEYTEDPDVDPDAENDEPDADRIYTVYIIIDDEITEQYVTYGDSAAKPDDPNIDGKQFIGWDSSFDNITSDRTITALFDDTEEPEVTSDENTSSVHTVTVVIGDKITTQEVPDGGEANIPSSITLEGYTFKGWDSDYSNVTSDITVSAVLEPISCNVTFIVDGVSYFTTVGYGETVHAPVSPTENSHGQSFTGWDKPLSGIMSDTTITAVYDTSEETASSYTVTFIVDGISYTQTVSQGGSASAPIPPETNSQGETFRGWDKDYSDVNSDMTITAVYN